MSESLSIRRVRHTGSPVYVGQVEGVDTWTSNPARIVEWLCDAYRFRFNQHRALRQVGVWTPDPENPGKRVPLRGADGAKVLRTLGTDPVRISDKQARLLHPHLAAVPVQVLQHPERVENTEWWAAVKRRRTLRDKHVAAGAMPRFRSAKAGDKRFGVWHNGGRNAVLTRTSRSSGVLVIRGQNPAGHRVDGVSPRWQLRITVRLPRDVPEDYTSVQVDWARRRVTVVCAPTPAPTTSPAPDRAVGIDRGVTHAAVTSDGAFLDVPSREREERLLKLHRKALSRADRAAGGRRSRSRRRAEHKRLVALHSRRLAAARRDWAHKTSRSLVDSYGTIAFEDLDVRAITRAAHGAVVRSKAALNRGVLASAWGSLRAMTGYKAAMAGRTVIDVPAPYTSQRCHECGHTAPENRESQAVFRCTRCGHTGNADVNAARNIRDDGVRLLGRTGPAVRGGRTGRDDVAPALPRDPRTTALPA